MSILKNIVRIIQAIFLVTLIVNCPHVGAETTYIPIEQECSRNPMVAPTRVFAGVPDVQYTITTEGLKSGSVVEKIMKVGLVGRAHRNLHVYVEARCIPSGEEANISLTGNFLMCGAGEGIELAMLEPNSHNPHKYHYVGILAITRDKDKGTKPETVVDGIFTEAIFGHNFPPIGEKLGSLEALFPNIGSSLDYLK